MVNKYRIVNATAGRRRGVGEDWVVFGTRVQFSGDPTGFSGTLTALTEEFKK